MKLRRMAPGLLAAAFLACSDDGPTAIEVARSHCPEIVLLDIGLPGIDGVEATRLLKADVRTRETPVVAVTAYAMPDDERRMRDAGCDAFLTKPLKLQELVSIAEGLIQRRISRP